MSSLKTAQYENAYGDISKALLEKDMSTDDLLRLYAAHSSTTAPDMSSVNENGIHIVNPVKSRNLIEVIQTVQSHIARFPEEKKNLEETIARTRELADAHRAYCLVNYDTYEVVDSSDEAVRDTLTAYQTDLKRQIDLSYGLETTTPSVSEPTFE